MTGSCALPFTTNVTILNNFHITNSPFLSSNIPSSPAYGVFISQLIRYARACSSYECFILRAARLSSKLLGQGYVMERLKSSLRKFYGRYGDLIKHYEVSLSPNVTWHSGTWPYTMTHSIDQTLHQFANLLPNWRTLLPILTILPNFGGFHRTLQRVRLANRGRLLLRTPGPVPFGTYICSNVETILSWTCHVYEPFEFRTSLGTSILLNYGQNIIDVPVCKIQPIFFRLRTKTIHSASYEQRNMSARRGALFVPIGIPTICWKTFPAKTTKMLSTRNSSILIMLSSVYLFLYELLSMVCLIFLSPLRCLFEICYIKYMISALIMYTKPFEKVLCFICGRCEG